MSKWESYVLEQTISPDPAARYVPLYGKLLWTYGLFFICLFLMIASCIVGNGIAPLSINRMLGPTPQALRLMGGLNTSAVRNGEWWRLLWAPFLHAGWFHILMNFGLWYQLGVMVEPDWGFFRTGLVFMISALSGTLMSATLSPSTPLLEKEGISVGASGGIFGIMGGCVPYVIEYWHTIPQPKCMLYIVIVSLVIGLVSGFLPFVDNYCHIGGAVGGILGGFMTISKIEIGKRRHPAESSPERTPTLEQMKYQRGMSRAGTIRMVSELPPRYTRVDAVAIIRVPKDVSADAVVESATPAMPSSEGPRARQVPEDSPRLALHGSCHAGAQEAPATFSTGGPNGVPEACNNHPRTDDKGDGGDPSVGGIGPGKQDLTAPASSDGTNEPIVRALHDHYPAEPKYDETRHHYGLQERFPDKVAPSFALRNRKSSTSDTCSGARLGFAFDSAAAETVEGYEKSKSLEATGANAVARDVEAPAEGTVFRYSSVQNCTQATADFAHPYPMISTSPEAELHTEIVIDNGINAYHMVPVVEHDGLKEEQQQQPHLSRCEPVSQLVGFEHGPLDGDPMPRHSDWDPTVETLPHQDAGYETEMVQGVPQFQHDPLVSSAPVDIPEDVSNVSPVAAGGAEQAVGEAKEGDASEAQNLSTAAAPPNSAVRRFRVNFQEPFDRLESRRSGEFPQRPAASPSLIAPARSPWTTVVSYLKKPYRPREEQKAKIPSRMTVRCTEEEDVDDSFKWGSRTVWAVRFSSACFLFILWYSLFYFLLICPTCYTPPGSISFFS